MMEHIRSRKGVTIAEVVIALTIIAIISAFTLSLIVMSFGVENKSEVSIEVKNAAENAIECYRFAKNNYKEKITGLGEAPKPYVFTELVFSCLEKTGEYKHGSLENGVFVESQMGIGNIFCLTIDGCTILIKVDLDGFSFTAQQGGEEVYNFDFPGGAS